MNELNIVPESIEFRPGTLKLNNFDEILSSANRLADKVSGVVVTEDSVKENKKLRAAVNKSINSLQSEARRYKKELLKPYDEFDKQIKQISEVVTGANAIVDGQIKELEQAYRDNKQGELEKIYDQRMKRTPDFTVPFTSFMDSHRSLLNKSVSMNKAEETIAEFIHKITTDTNTLKILPYSNLTLDFYFKNGCDLNLALAKSKEFKDILEGVKGDPSDDNTISSDGVTFTVSKGKDSQLVEQYLKLNKIDYTRGN